ncbi:MAG: PIN domain-containing protein [Bacteroidales bacterium]|nr:PIN domain-containing protein [Bacteroidales bacterium]
MSHKVFLDTNILMDLLLQRPGYESSAKILQAGEDGGISLYCSYLTMANLAFILRKSATPAVIVPSMMQIQSLVTVLPMDSEQLLEAYNLSGRDFEDILQAVCAARGGCDVIITNNPKDYRIGTDKAKIKLPCVMTPAEFLDDQA